MYTEEHIRYRDHNGVMEYLTARYDFDHKTLTISVPLQSIAEVYITHDICCQWVSKDIEQEIQEHVIRAHKKRCSQARQDFYDRDEPHECCGDDSPKGSCGGCKGC